MGIVMYEELRTSLELVHNAQQSSERDTEALIRSLERLEPRLSQMQGADSDVPAIRSILTTHATSGEALTAVQVEKLREELEEIRLQVILASASVGLLEPAALERLILVSDVESRPTLIRYESGLSVTAVGDKVIVFLPIIDEGHRSVSYQTVRGLSQVVGDAPWKDRWILDFSAVRRADTELLASVVGISREISLRGGTLHLCWLRGSLLPSGIGENVKKTLDLVQVGAHLFSRPMIEKTPV